VDGLSFLTGAGTIPVIAALSAWLGKIWAGRILEKDQVRYQTRMESLLEDLRTRESKELFVHRLQFEKEFEIYETLWRKLYVFNPWLKSFDEIMSPKLVHDRAQRLPHMVATLSETVCRYQPFYYPEIFAKCAEFLMSIAEIQALDVKISTLSERQRSDAVCDAFDETYHELQERIESSRQSIETVGGLIRKRIWSTREKGWDRAGN
jgi:hypothetical protein